jgi:hypothetical protein
MRAPAASSRRGPTFELTEKAHIRCSGLLFKAPPQSCGQLVEGGEIWGIGITIAAWLVREVPDVLHQDRAQRMHRIMPVETFSEKAPESTRGRRKTLRKLVLDHRMGQGMRVQVGQLDTAAAVILADQLEALALVQLEPRRRIRRNRRIVVRHVLNLFWITISRSDEMSRPPTPGPQIIWGLNTHSRCKGEGTMPVETFSEKAPQAKCSTLGTVGPRGDDPTDSGCAPDAKGLRTAWRGERRADGEKGVPGPPGQTQA